MSGLLEVAQWVGVAYVAGINLGYLALTLVSFAVLTRRAQRTTADAVSTSDFEPPVSLVVAAYNEEAIVAASVRSLMQLRYSQFEIIVVNDGSTDRTLRVLRDAFGLRPFPEALRVRIPTARVRGVYRSARCPDLRVIDKENGGKADASNAGINAARYPLVCVLDADGILQPDSLSLAVRPFVDDARTVASGGVVRIANGCDVVGGWLMRAGVPRSGLALCQVVEYCRAFLFGRVGWSHFNALLVISGAFGVFHKDTVIEAGGYRTDVLGEDMELVIRLHRRLSAEGRPYRIAFAADPVCWTEAPESLGVLRRQRVRWQRGLCESLSLNRSLLFHRRGGAAGWIGFPFALIFEALSPLVEACGYVLLGAGYLLGYVDLSVALAFLAASIGLGVLLSVSSLLLDEMSFHTYPRLRHVLLLLLAAVGENFWYRQLNTAWRVEGLVRWLVRSRAVWGEMTRTAGWNSELDGTRASTERS